ncbi:hypothetical protein FRB95_002684 [Tulasnella sp. JGI-2019a]|nr:hypothetical protein FRB95_002684 [Tulasnella sp. JGI-2019a]
MSTSTSAALLGFRNLESLTYEEYSSLPLATTILDRSIDKLTEEDFHCLDFTLATPGEAPPLNEITPITSSGLGKVKDNIRPAFRLDLVEMARIGMVPKPLPNSKPDFNYDPVVVTSAADVHKDIEARTLANIHYAFRLHALLYEISMLQKARHGVMELEQDERVTALVEQEALTALHTKWRKTKIFSKEKKLGLAQWLLADADVARNLEDGKRPAAATGAVLLAYAPYWMVGKETLENIEAPQGLPDPNAPTWFGGLRAACKRINVQHLLIYTGEFLVVGTFNIQFDAITLSPPLDTFCGYGIGYGINATTGRVLRPFSSLNICLGQVVTQLLADAKANAAVPVSVDVRATNPIATRSPQAPIQSPPFPLTDFVATSREPTEVRTPFVMRCTRPRHHAHPYQRPTRSFRGDTGKTGALSSVGSDPSRPAPLPSVMRGRITPSPKYNPNKMVKLGPKRPQEDNKVSASLTAWFGGQPFQQPNDPCMAGPVRYRTMMLPPVHIVKQRKLKTKGPVAPEASTSLTQVPGQLERKPSAMLIHRSRIFQEELDDRQRGHARIRADRAAARAAAPAPILAVASTTAAAPAVNEASTSNRASSSVSAPVASPSPRSRVKASPKEKKLDAAAQSLKKVQLGEKSRRARSSVAEPAPQVVKTVQRRSGKAVKTGGASDKISGTGGDEGSAGSRKMTLRSHKRK